MRFGNSVPKQKEYFRQERTGIRKNKRNFRIQIISQQFSSRHTSIHSCTFNHDYNIGDNIHYAWTIKIKALVANLVMQCIKGVEATDMSDVFCMCKTQWYIMGMLIILL